MTSLQLTFNDLFTLLSIIAVAMVIILTYQLIFVSVSLRRIMDRAEQVSKDLEAVILKPISAVDYLLDWFLAFIENMKPAGGEKKKKNK
jgi:ABC-type uncharacterized transport system permease subunit